MLFSRLSYLLTLVTTYACLSLFNCDYNAASGIIIDNTYNFAEEIFCGNRVQIKHRTSDLCLTIMNKNDEIGLKQCFEIDENQHWVIDCCDAYLLRCATENPIHRVGDHLSYDSYFRLRHANRDKDGHDWCISTSNKWKPGKNYQNVFLERCQGSYLDITNSAEQEYNMLKDKFATQTWYDQTAKVSTNHFVQLINLGQSGCLCYDFDPERNPKHLLQGFSCNTGLEKNHKFQYRFVVLEDNIQK